MRLKRSACIILLALLVQVSFAGADFWTSRVTTNTSSWSIYRQTENMSFDITSSVEGEVSPVAYSGRMLQPYHSRYTEIKAGDLMLAERTGALAGSYRSEDSISLKSSAEASIDISVVKPVGTEVFTIDYTEQWPALLISRRAVDYSGTGIDEREFAWNNGDYVRSSFLHNSELSKERGLGMLIERMNATVHATNQSIIDVSFEPSKFTSYAIRAETSGISNLGYRQSGPRYIVDSRSSYETLNWNDETYYGKYDIYRSMVMDSQFPRVAPGNETYGYLPCGCLISELAAAHRVPSDEEIFGV